jgi:hypothetical protein
VEVRPEGEQRQGRGHSPGKSRTDRRKWKYKGSRKEELPRGHRLVTRSGHREAWGGISAALAVQHLCDLHGVM